MTNPTTTAPVAAAPIAPAPITAPVAPAPAAASFAPAPTAAGAVLPPGFGTAGGPPRVGTVGNSAGSGIPDEHFDKPILFRIINVVSTTSQYEDGQFPAPVVDYIVLDPATGGFTEVRGATIKQKNIRKDLINASQRGDSYVAAVATQVPPKNGGAFPAKVLRDLDENNSGYGVEAAKEHLINAARGEGWF